MSERTRVASRRFTMVDQRAFAALSLDANPIHVDELAARRTMFGVPVVHGVHLVLWALEELVTRYPVAPSRLTVNFKKPCFVDEEVDLEIVSRTPEHADLRVTSGELLLCDVKVELGGNAIPARGPAAVVDPATGPLALDLGDMDGRGGDMHVVSGGSGVRDLFPALGAAMGDTAVAQVTALSRLVGMECPGLHSLFASFDVVIDPTGDPERFAWSVLSAHELFALVTMGVREGVVNGTVRAFLRPPPATQASMTSLAAAVGGSEFAGSKALVVGGSRGLGELAAKAIASGGGEVVVTYHRGAADAERVSAEIDGAGGRATALQLDVVDPGPAFDELAARNWRPTHLLYFASPRIFARRHGLFDVALFQTFVDAYVTGFISVLEGCRALGVEELAVFYPSTVAIDERVPDLLEYAAAKVAAEQLISSLVVAEPWLRVHLRRLPRLPTDQTATLSAVEEADPVATMVDVVRATYRNGATGPLEPASHLEA